MIDFVRYKTSIEYIENTSKLLHEKDENGNTILFHLVNSYLKLDTIKYFFGIINCQKLFLEKNLLGKTFLHELLKNTNVEIIKYVFDLTKKECPNLFLEKYEGQTILHYIFSENRYIPSMKIIKYIFEFVNDNFPSLFLEEDRYGKVILHTVFGTMAENEVLYYVVYFIKNNYPKLISVCDDDTTIIHYLIFTIIDNYLEKDLKLLNLGFDCVKNICPDIFLRNYFHYYTIDDITRLKDVDKYISNYMKNNIPEILPDEYIQKSITKNLKNYLVLPLTFQIQN